MSSVRALHAERPIWLSQDLFPFDSHFVDVDGRRVHYVDEGEGPVLLFLPGAPNWSFFYRRFVDALRDEFRCVALDYPGSGLSSVDPGQTPTVSREAYLAPYTTCAARRDPVLLLADLAGNDAYMAEIEQALQTRLDHLPVLLLWGDLPRFQRILPGAHTLTLPGAHHFPFAEAPDEMVAEIRRWWRAESSMPAARRVS